MKLKDRIWFCCTLASLIVANLPDISDATRISITNEYQEVYSYSRCYPISDTEQSYLASDGTIGVSSNAANSYGNVNGSATQTANAFFNSNYDLNIRLLASVRSNENFASAYYTLNDRSYSKYLLDFNIDGNTTFELKTSNLLQDIHLASFTLNLINTDTNTKVFTGSYIPLLTLAPFDLAAGNYELYALLDTGSHTAVLGEEQNRDGQVGFECSIDANPVPEPSTLFLLGAGLAGVGLVRIKSKGKNLSTV